MSHLCVVLHFLIFNTRQQTLVERSNILLQNGRIFINDSSKKKMQILSTDSGQVKHKKFKVVFLYQSVM